MKNSSLDGVTNFLASCDTFDIEIEAVKRLCVNLIEPDSGIFE